MTFEPFNRVLEGALKGVPNIEKKKKEGLVFTQWQELVGSVLSKHTAVEFVRSGTLFIRVSDPIWMHELQYLKPVIIKKIRDEIGEGIIQDIHLRMGEIPSFPEKKKGERTLGVRRISKKKKETIERLLSAISDLELKEGLRRILTKAARFGR
jgi:hypothetical protein